MASEETTVWQYIAAGFGTATLFIADLLRRSIGKNVANIKESVDSIADRQDSIEHRQAKNEAETKALKVHVSTGASERQEIKKAIDKIDGKIDKVIDHLIT